MQLVQLFLHAFRTQSCKLSNLTYGRKRFLLQALRGLHNETGLSEQDLELDSQERQEYTEISEDCLGVAVARRVCVLQPYIKWGKGKKQNTTPELQLAEAVALVNTLPGWSVVQKRLVPLLTLQQKKLLGSGALDNLKEELRRDGTITAVFVSTNRLKFVQLAELQAELRLPIYDRYSLIIHIFRQHAVTMEAKLQVALAELPYVKRKMQELGDSQGKFRAKLNEKTKLLLEKRERRLRNAMKKLEMHRELISQQRKRFHFPTVAVVGYTNAGKTSLIKALTGKKELVPEDKLFATLDTTVHEGVLPCSMKVLFVDTIGFIQDVPENLIEPFNVTLRDAVNADVLVHIYDASHPDMEAQLAHVRETLSKMAADRKPVEVANKCDLLDDRKPLPDETLRVSALQQTGIQSLLDRLEDEVLSATGKTVKRIRVKSGSPEYTWLYKMTTVVNVEVEPARPEFVVMEVIADPGVVSKFTHMVRSNGRKIT